MAASPWPMPAVSTMISSKPAALHAAMASPSAAESELPVSRVANERMKIPLLQLLGRVLRRIKIAARQHVVDHALQPQTLPVLGRVDARDAVVLQLLDLGRHDDAAAAAEHLDVLAAALPQQVEHVLEELDVSALVGGDGDALHVLLQRGTDDLLDRAVVPEVDHLGARGLQDAPHDVDRRVVAVEQARRGDEADLVLRLVDELG